MGELSSLFTDAIEQVNVSVYSLIPTTSWLACLINQCQECNSDVKFLNNDESEEELSFYRRFENTF